MQVVRGTEQIPDFERAVVTIGSFDGVHFGHQKIFDRIKSIAKQINGKSVVITFDPHPRQVVYPKDNSLKLISTVEEKLDLLSNQGIDYCVLVPFTIEFSQLAPREYVEKFLIAKFKPEYVIIGYDHKFGLNREGDISLLKTYADDGVFKLVEIEKQVLEEISISSTKIRDAISSGFIIKANELLGHTFSLSGKVIKGEQIGRQLDYPTANVKVDSGLKIIPKSGIYAADVELDSDRYPAMLYIGSRPTVNSDKSTNAKIEVHILDFDEDIYERPIKIFVHKYIRAEQKYDDLSSLRNAISDDEIIIRAYFEALPFRLNQKAIVNVSILNYNGVDYLDTFLPFIYESTSKELDISIIDNKSTDESITLIEQWFPDIKLIKLEQNHGFAQGYNLGIAELDYKYIAILNSDVKVSPGWLDPIIDLMESDRSIAIVQPKIRSLEYQEEFEYAGAAGGYIDALAFPFCRGRIFDQLEKDESQYDEDAEIFWASGAAMVVRKDVWDKLEGFDADYFAHQEEIDFCWRVKRSGYKILCCTKSHVYHLGGGTLNYDNPRKDYLNFRNNLKTLIKNSSASSLVIKLPIKLLLDFIAALRFVFQGKFNSSLAVLKAHGSVYSKIPTLIRTKRHYSRLIEKAAVGPARNSGLYSGSIVWAYYVKGINKFKDLKF